MRAALFTEAGAPLQIVDDIDLEPPRTGEVRVRVVACGVCHSDLSLVRGTFPAMGPTVCGHEAAGVVVEVGPGVRALSVGDHVVLSPNPSCGRCAYCREGSSSACAPTRCPSRPRCCPTARRGSAAAVRWSSAAWGSPRGRTRWWCPSSGAIRIDADVPLDVACVIGCAVQTGVGAAINTVSIAPGDAVLVLGAGGIGVSIVQGAAISGASRIIVSDPSESRREQAMRFGATHVIDPTDDRRGRRHHGAHRHRRGRRVRRGGLRGARSTTAMDAIRNGGTTVMVGAAPVDDAYSMVPALAMFTEKRLVGSLLGSCWAPRDIPRMVELWRSGRLDLDSMVTSRRPLEQVNEAIADLEAGRGLRTVLMISDA